MERWTLDNGQSEKINHSETRTGAATLYYKTINHVSILLLQRWQKKKSGKLKNS
jgi:hypothetical protein